MNLLNQYSYPLFGLGLLLFTFLTLQRVARTRWIIIAIVESVILVALISGFIILRPGDNTVDDLDEALATIGNGRPTMIEFLSNYCTVCMTISPMVDDLIGDIEGEFNVMQIDIHSSVGRELREELGFSFTPEFVLYDANGVEVWREHVPPTDAELDRARRAESDAP